MKTTTDWIDGRLLIPELLREVPQARNVLDRYGLQGCGGEGGPVETLEFFAGAHEVPLPRLLDELRGAVDGPVDAAPPRVSLADTIYRPFFKSGILLVLTLGAVWGAYLLLRIGFTGNFRAAGLHEINAHGHAQIFGWVGLFVMGFAYQAFPRFKHTTLAHPNAAVLSFGLMLAGIVARAIGEPLAAQHSWLLPLVVAASALEVVAIGLFVWVLAATWKAAGKGLTYYDGYIICALAWFFAQAVFDAIYVTATLTATGREELISLVGTWQGALREMQIHGFALLMVLGVSQRVFHHFYGFSAPRPRLSLTALVLLNAAIVGEIVGSILLRGGGRMGVALWYGSVLLLAGTVVVLVGSWHIFRRPRETDRSLKFLRAAYVWLFVSLAMLVLLPVYQFVLLKWLAPGAEAAQMGFSHAYYGAIRHAITVGFISLMIVGVAAKVVPTLNGVDLRVLRGLWLPFVLLNAGCALRVVGQTLTDFSSVAFPFAGVSGLLEVTGLALWGVHLWRVMAGRASSVVPAVAYRAGDHIEGHHRVGEVLDHHPELLDTLIALGFRPLANPFLRRTVARFTTIDQGCRLLGMKCPEITAALNDAIQASRAGRYPLQLKQDR